MMKMNKGNKTKGLIFLAAIIVLITLLGCYGPSSDGYTNLLDQNNNSSTNQNVPLAVSPNCTDSDAGKDIFTLGYVNGTCIDCAQGTTSGSNTDSCIDLASGQLVLETNSGSVAEFYCTQNGWKREVIPCANGCSNGACRQ